MLQVMPGQRQRLPKGLHPALRCAAGRIKTPQPSLNLAHMIMIMMVPCTLARTDSGSPRGAPGGGGGGAPSSEEVVMAAKHAREEDLKVGACCGALCCEGVWVSSCSACAAIHPYTMCTTHTHIRTHAHISSKHIC